MSDYSDVLIIGAGFSGIGAAYRIREQNPNLSYTILERRERLGGTWDLFQYPGIRSDSDIFTLSFPWEPWTRKEMIADGDDIWQYMADTARKHGIDEHIRFNTHVHRPTGIRPPTPGPCRPNRTASRGPTAAGSCSSGPATTTTTSRTRQPFPGIEDFKGEVVHPQHWPETFDYAGKRLVVIGSGATAVSMIPSLAEKAAHVTMLQRTPSYLLSAPRVQPGDERYPESPAAQVSHWSCAAHRRCSAGLALVGLPRGTRVQQASVARRRREEPASGIRHRHPFQAAVQPVGSADVLHPRRRPLPGHRRRTTSTS